MLSGLRSMPRLVDLGIGFAPPGRAFWAASAASLDRPFKPARTPCTPLRSALLFPAVAIAVTPPQSRRRHGGVTAAPRRQSLFPAVPSLFPAVAIGHGPPRRSPSRGPDGGPGPLW